MTPLSSPVPNILGTIATVCWCVNLLPQIRRNYKAKSTEGLPTSMLLLWAASGVLAGVYAISQRFSAALIVQPHSFAILCGISWAQCLVYGRNWHIRNVLVILTTVAIAFAAIETGLVVAMRYTFELEWPATIVGVAACVLDLLGFMSLPYTLIKSRGRVVGIDFFFLGLDSCGFFFSLLALATQRHFDWLFGITSAICCTFELGIVLSHVIWMFRTRQIRMRAKEAEKVLDDFEEFLDWQAQGMDIYSMLRRCWQQYPGLGSVSESDTVARTAMHTQ